MARADGIAKHYASLEWPSTLYAVELLAWDVFLGLSLLFAAFVFRGPGLPTAVRWSLSVAGGLCLLGTAGPLMGDMAVQRVGIIGYGVGLPISSVLIALTFRKRSRSAAANAESTRSTATSA